MTCSSKSASSKCAVLDGARGTIQVMGAHLRQAGNDLEEWDEALAKLQNAERLELDSSDTLFKRLRISYDALDAPEQRMFLDAATVFLGRRADTVKCAWR